MAVYIASLVRISRLVFILPLWVLAIPVNIFACAGALVDETTDSLTTLDDYIFSFFPITWSQAHLIPWYLLY